MLHRSSYLFWGVFALACTQSAPEAVPPSLGTRQAPRSSTPTSQPATRLTPSPPALTASATAPPSATAASAPPSAPSHFPPADVAPPSATSAKSAGAGDGHFTPFASAALRERAATEPPVVVRTVLHPHPDSRWITVTVAALDLTRLAVHLVPGTEDLAWASLPVPNDAGLVPKGDQGALVAVFNGGFQPKHGRWGLAANGVVVSRLRDGGCTLVVGETGRVRIAPFADLPEDARAAGTFRQTPPCLVASGAVHPSLLAGNDRAWAGHTADLQTRRRSAVGIDASGEVLFYALGEEAEPRWLAEGMKLAGAAFAAELDINWNWTRFLLFGQSGKERLHVTTTLVPKMEHGETQYVSRPSTRDFFYVSLRPR